MTIATAALLRLLWTKRCKKPCCCVGEDGIALMAMQSPCDSTKSPPLPCQYALESASEGQAPSIADVWHSSADRLSEGPGRSPVVLEKELGTGGFGTVWQGQWMHSAVAVKKFKMTEKGVQDVMHKFDREVKTLRALRHPNICSFFDTCLVDGALAIVLELLTGGTLGEYLGIRKSLVEPSGSIELSDSSTDTEGEALAPRGQAAPNRPWGWSGVPPGELLRLAKDVALGLHYLHVNNVTHLDVKLGNVMVHHGQAKLCDFGFSTLKTATAAAEQQLSRTFSSGGHGAISSS